MAEQVPPVTDKSLPQWSAVMAQKLVATPTVWCTTALVAGEYANCQNDYVGALAVARDPDTKGPRATKAKDAVKADLIGKSRDVIRVIRGQVGLTDEQLFSIGVPVRKQAQSIPVPGSSPATQVTGVRGRAIAMRVLDADVTNKRGKPAGCVAAWVYFFAGATYPSDPTLWNFAGSFTKADVEIAVPTSVAGGSPVWVCAAWINAKQEAGPPSAPLQTHVQGGGVNAEAAAAKLKLAA